MRTFSTLFVSAAALLAPLRAAALCACPGLQAHCLCVGETQDLPTLIWRVVLYLSYAIGAFATTCFIIGGFLVVISRGQEPYLPRGKALMIESLIGLALVLGAQGILRLVVWVLYAPA